MLRKWLLGALLAAISTVALAEPPTANGPGVQVWDNYFTNAKPTVGTAITRPANTTAYTANEIVCAATCAPIQFEIAPGRAAQARVSRVSLLKTGTGATNASFTLWLYAISPTLTGLSDQSAYTGPFAADMNYYLGNAVCATGNATSDATAQRWYECTLSNPNFNGVINVQSWQNSRIVYGILSANGAYTPASGETFTPYLSGVY